MTEWMEPEVAVMHFSAVYVGVIGGALLAVVVPALGQTPDSTSLQRLEARCAAINRTSDDLLAMQRALGGEVSLTYDIVHDLQATADMADQDCESVRDLLFMAGLVSGIEARARASAYVHDRIESYIRLLASYVSSTNSAIAYSTRPGVAESAQQLRDEIRDFEGTLRGLPAE